MKETNVLFEQMNYHNILNFYSSGIAINPIIHIDERVGSNLSTRDVSNHKLPTPKVSPTKCPITICQKTLCTKKQKNVKKDA